MQFEKIERLINLADGYRKIFSIRGTQYLLVQEFGQIHIIVDECPHQQKRFGRNCIHQNILRCPWHGIEYDISSGKSLNPSNQSLRLQKIAPSYEGPYVGIYF